MGYRIIRRDRDTRGGGVAVILEENLIASRLEDIPDIECVWVKVHFSAIDFVIGAFYKPPQSGITFFEKLNEYLCCHNLSSRNLILAGDFNTPAIDWCSTFPIALSSTAEPLVDIALFHNLSQLVLHPTRISGATQSTLDLFFVSESLSLKQPVVTVFDGISDHMMTFCSVPIHNARPVQSNIVHVHDFANADDTSILDLLDFSFSDFTSLRSLEETTIDDL